MNVQKFSTLRVNEVQNRTIPWHSDVSRNTKYTIVRIDAAKYKRHYGKVVFYKIQKYHSRVMLYKIQKNTMIRSVVTKYKNTMIRWCWKKKCKIQTDLSVKWIDLMTRQKEEDPIHKIKDNKTFYF